MNSHKLSFGFKVAGVVMLFCLLVMAQPSMGQISGTVRDQFGQAISNATVTIRNKNTGARRQVTTNRSGKFEASVPIGRYEITVLVRGFSEKKQADVLVAIGQSKPIEITYYLDYAPPHPIFDPILPPGPVELTWNAWAEPVSRSPSFRPVAFLEPNKNYQLVLDLAALAYRDLADIYTKAAGDQLKDWLLKSEAPEVNLKLLIIPDERFFKSANRTETLPINLERLRTALNEGIEIPETPFALLQQNPNRNFSFGRVQINLETRKRQGTGSVAIALWADGVPVDELSIPLCVAANAVAASKCTTANKLHDSLAGIDPVRAATQQEAFSLKPDAALHFVELNSTTQVGIFRDNTWPEGKYVSWKLERGTRATRTDLQQILARFDRSTNDAHLLPVGIELYNLLFPTDEEKARQAFADFIARPRERRDPANPPSIFVRILTGDNEEPPFLIPLGIMVHDIDGKKDFLGFHFRIQTPLQIQDYEPYSKCINNWVVLAPEAGASGIPPELNEARERFSTWFETWEFKPIPDMDQFINWAEEIVSETEPLSLFILAHQDSNSLYFEDNPTLGPNGIQRRFATPSVAFVNGCETGAPGSSAIVQKLNERGVSAVIATAGKVDRLLAGDFFSVLGHHLTSNPAGQEYPLGIAHFLTLKELRNRKPLPNRFPYGAKALAYEVMGNSSLRICSPPLKPR
jgi:hypothetical protein